MLLPNGKDYDSIYEFMIDYTTWYVKTYKPKTTDLSRFLFHVAGGLQNWLKDRGEFK